MTPFVALDRLLDNLWWTWSSEARALVRSIDPGSWDEHRGFVAPFLASVSQQRWSELEESGDFQDSLEKIEVQLESYLFADETWWLAREGEQLDAGIAYFSMEFGIHEGLPIYSGGLGVLAGDHLKSASDLGVPLVAVGLFYREGYFHQVIGEDGAQSERYVARSAQELGIEEVRRPDGEPVVVRVPFEGRVLHCGVSALDVGRVTLLLLDADHPENSPQDRELTARLYGGDERTRIAQEMILGIGGMRALRAVGLEPALFHLNEGHCSFVLAERLREEWAAGADAALDTVRSSAVFTTHTPVPAGHDRFSEELVRRSFAGWDEGGGPSVSQLLELGSEPGAAPGELCMTALALRGCRATNGVSEKHGEVSREMWECIWPQEPSTPIGHITNGVHTSSWLGAELQALLDRRLAGWRERIVSDAPLTEVLELPRSELWSTHQAQKQRMIEFVASRTGVSLDPRGLVVGFARRFAPYKRGDLILSQLERAIALLSSEERPLQLVYAGKAHPRDALGKEILQRICSVASEPRLKGRLVVVEDYEIAVGRALVQGVDVWLNNPRRPLEASGTSGQKVAMNGGLNCSTLDGWWLEGFAQEPLAGWAVGSAEPSEDVAAGDAEDAEALYGLLEQEILPCFYDRDSDGLPQAWLERMAASIAVCLPAFSSERMLVDYVQTTYLKG